MSRESEDQKIYSHIPFGSLIGQKINSAKIERNERKCNENGWQTEKHGRVPFSPELPHRLDLDNDA
jgi:hypothetical protein